MDLGGIVAPLGGRAAAGPGLEHLPRMLLDMRR
jgi:hypothetical protein